MSLLYNPEELTSEVTKKLREFEKIITKWNNNIHLVSSNNGSVLWERHITDSLQLVPFLKGVNKLADMGSGIGFPAVPLSLACPDSNFFAIETSQKKTSLLTQIVRNLGIPNLHVIPEKAQSVIISHMDVVSCRAFGEFLRDAGLAYKMLKPGGVFITFKAEEEYRIPEGYKKVTNHKYRLKSHVRDFYVVIAHKLGEFD